MNLAEAFRDRPLLLGVSVSLLWHFFWFFSVSIEVSPAKSRHKARPKTVSLGAVLDDTLFRTLVETKPQLSETFYRRPEDFSGVAPPEPKAQTIERYESGDVVSVPFGKRFFNSLRNLVGGTKASPEYEFAASRLEVGYPDDVAELEGDLRNREVLSRPKKPLFPPEADPLLRDSVVEIQFAVDSSGAVTYARVISSSGDKGIDSLWLRYLRRWQFAPSGLGRVSSSQQGKIKFRFS